MTFTFLNRKSVLEIYEKYLLGNYILYNLELEVKLTKDACKNNNYIYEIPQ